MTTRRPRWHPPPPPTPKIIHLPRRLRRPKHTKPVTDSSTPPALRRPQGKLGSLFVQERDLHPREVPVVLLSSTCDMSGTLGAGEEGERRLRVLREHAGAEREEKEGWKFQAEFLRAECHFLRMEREVALKKLERNRVQTEKAMRSAVQALSLGRSMIDEGENAGFVLEEEIQVLEEKLEEVQSWSPRVGCGRDTVVARNGCNFDKKASALRRRMHNLGPTVDELAEEKRCVKEIRDLAEASLGAGRHRKPENKLADVELIRKKMEGLSKGMLERMEEYGGLLGGSRSPASSIAPMKAELQETEVRPLAQEKRCGEDWGVCSGRCKLIVKKIVDQVRSETEQWTQLQAMLGQVREEMVELQVSKDKWQRRAVESHTRLQTTRSDMQEWKHRAKRAETKEKEMEMQILELQTEMQAMRSSEDHKQVADMETAWGLAKLKDGSQKTTAADQSHKEKEKRVLICRLKENMPANNGKREKEEPEQPSRWPLGELGNNNFQSPSIRSGRAAVAVPVALFPKHYL